MYAISFDLSINALKEHYDKKPPSAYVEIKNTLKGLGYEWIQGSVYVYTASGEEEGPLAQVTKTVLKLKKIDWFRKCVRDVRIFRIEEWSDFTTLIKDENL